HSVNAAMARLTPELFRDNAALMAVCSEQAASEGCSMEQWLFAFFRERLVDSLLPPPLSERRIELVAELAHCDPDATCALLSGSRAAGVGFTRFAWEESISHLRAKYGALR